MKKNKTNTNTSLAVTTTVKLSPPPSKKEIIDALVERERADHSILVKQWCDQNDEIAQQFDTFVCQYVQKNIKTLKLGVMFQEYDKRAHVEILISSHVLGEWADEMKKHLDREPKEFNAVRVRENIVAAMEKQRLASILGDPVCVTALDSIRDRLKSTTV